jgi:hypothetical protein
MLQACARQKRVEDGRSSTGNEGPKPEGLGQIWAKVEVKTVLHLELQLPGESYNAKKANK